MAGPDLPRPDQVSPAWRWVLTVFLLFLGGGWVVAQVNIWAQNELADGRAGLSWRDLMLRYHGDWVSMAAGEAAPSRMLEMIRGAMRQYFSSDDDYEVLLGWLKDGASREAFESGAEPTPHDVLFKCLRCHSGDSREPIGAKAPFGPDRFTVEYARVARFALPAAAGQTRVWRPPLDWREMVMSMHAHAFGVPMFLLALAALYLWAVPASGAPRARALLATGPLACFFIDLASWPLARLPGAVGTAFVALIPIAGAAFGVTYLVQWVAVMAALWRRPLAALRARIAAR